MRSCQSQVSLCLIPFLSACNVAVGVLAHWRWCCRSMECHVLADIHEHFCASMGGSGVCFALSQISFVSLQFAMHSSLFLGGIVGAVVHRFLMLLWAFASMPGMVTQTA